jgi:hypothetical protein
MVCGELLSSNAGNGEARGPSNDESWSQNLNVGRDLELLHGNMH